MLELFKRSYVPYICFLAGVLLIFLWARYGRTEGSTGGSTEGRVEGFETHGQGSSAVTANPYKFNMYYVDWCPHCHSAKPEFEKLGARQTIGGKTVQCEAIEAEKNPEKVLGKVSGYPSIRFYDPQGKMTEYEGERTQSGFQTFLQKMLGA